MEIIYKKIKDFSQKELQDLFLSVEWDSGNYPEKLKMAIKNSHRVYSAYDGDKLVGLINSLSDGVMTAYFTICWSGQNIKVWELGKNWWN